ncbi:MAG: hypothetical protein WDN76_08230 [Alphaproteobacteria bacterium]
MQALSQLSYGPIFFRRPGGRGGKGPEPRRGFRPFQARRAPFSLARPRRRRRFSISSFREFFFLVFQDRHRVVVNRFFFLDFADIFREAGRDLVGIGRTFLVFVGHVLERLGGDHFIGLGHFLFHGFFVVITLRSGLFDLFFFLVGRRTRAHALQPDRLVHRIKRVGAFRAHRRTLAEIVEFSPAIWANLFVAELGLRHAGHSLKMAASLATRWRPLSKALSPLFTPSRTLSPMQLTARPSGTAQRRSAGSRR